MRVVVTGTPASAWRAVGWLRARGSDAVEVEAPQEPPSPEVIAELAQVGIDLRGAGTGAGPADGVRFDAGPLDRDALLPQVDAFLEAHGRRARFGAAMRPHFLLEPGLAFLNHGSFGATPRVVLDARDAWSRRFEADPVRFEIEELGPRLRALAGRVGSLFGVPADELVFVDNASTGVSAVLRSLELRPGDVLVTTSHRYHSVNRALEHVAARAGARVHTIPLPFPVTSEAELVDAFVRGLPERAALAVFDHVTSATGLVFPVAAFVAACRARGIPTLVDGAHVPGMFPVDVGALGADFWTGNLHKWAFSPKGSAVLHVRAPWHGTIKPPTISNAMIGPGLAGEFDYQGTKDPSNWLAVGEALDFAESIGWDRLRAHNHVLRARLAARWCEAFGLQPAAPPELLGTLATLPMPDPTVDAAALNRHLREVHGIQAMFPTWGGRTWFRVSAQLYVEDEDLERLITALR
jgi:isopenicillin-N epimerase